MGAYLFSLIFVCINSTFCYACLVFLVWCHHLNWWLSVVQYEKAAASLKNNDPPIILAKIDANEESNKALAGEYEVRGFPTLKIIRNGGANIQDYKGPREADGIVEYLKKQAGPASVEIKSSEEAGSLIDDKKVFIVCAWLQKWVLFYCFPVFVLFSWDFY